MTRSSLVGLCLAVSCTGTVDPGADGGSSSADARLLDAGPVSPATYCSRFADAVCAAREGCGCDVTGCRDEQLAGCLRIAVSPGVAAAIAAGTILFDAAAADAQLAALATAAPACEHPFAALGWDYGGIRTRGGVLEGTLDAGADCDPDLILANECIDGWCPDPDRDGVGSCIRYVGLGEPCGGRRECFDLRAPVDSTDDVTSPSYWLACVGGICVEQLADGESCDLDTDCLSNRCDASLCEPLLADGEACAVAGDCQSARCEGGTCIARVVAGGSCSFPNDCVTGYCGAGACSVPPERAAGEACTLPIDCASRTCDAGRCAPTSFCALSGG